MLSERRAEASATAFFKQTINDSDLPEKEVMDKAVPTWQAFFRIAPPVINKALLNVDE